MVGTAEEDAGATSPWRPAPLLASDSGWGGPSSDATKAPPAWCGREGPSQVPCRWAARYSGGPDESCTVAVWVWPDPSVQPIVTLSPGW